MGFFELKDLVMNTVREPLERGGRWLGLRRENWFEVERYDEVWGA